MAAFTLLYFSVMSPDNRLNLRQTSKIIKLSLAEFFNNHSNSTANLNAKELHCQSEKLDPFSFEHNFGNGKYCPILIILSLLLTEINCDQAYLKIYHHTCTKSAGACKTSCAARWPPQYAPAP